MKCNFDLVNQFKFMNQLLADLKPFLTINVSYIPLKIAVPKNCKYFR